VKCIIVFFNDPTRPIVTVGPIETEREVLLEADRLEQLYDRVAPGALKSVVWKDMWTAGALEPNDIQEGKA
jgi:hypothetical protein